MKADRLRNGQNRGNMRSSKFILRRGVTRSAKGFALIASILAIFLLSAMGLLVFTLTTQEVRISSLQVGEKKAFCAAESGVNWVTQNFDPYDVTGWQVNQVPVNPTSDPQTLYTVTSMTRPTQGPEVLPLPGYSLGGAQLWGQNRYFSEVTGTNTRYNSTAKIEVSLGFGPIELSTTYR
jgi:hypothetical protein